ncbi:MAG: transposase, partial [Gemmataceae bacterium]|nr:transposase [Gemmataceae bacterium]
MPRKRTTYTAEFKLAAVRMIAGQEVSVAEVARRRDVGENPLRTWDKAVAAGGGAALPGHGTPTPADGEPGRLRAEVGRLRASGTRQEKPPPAAPADLTFRSIAGRAGPGPVRRMRG